jgi:hypothetical protein
VADNVGYTPGVGATVAADDIGGVLFQRLKLALGSEGVNQGDVQGATADPVGNELAMLVRSVAEDNAYTQELLNTIAQILRSVWQMGSAAGAPSLTVRNSTQADFQVTIQNNAAVNVNQIAGGSPQTTGGGSSPAFSTSNHLVVAQSQQYHPASLPQHIYANIQV